jgi:hypothetical protein
VACQQTSARNVLLTLYSCLFTPLLFFLAVSAFFPSTKANFTSFSSVATWFAPQYKESVAATAALNPVKNMRDFVRYLCGLDINRKKGSNSSLLFRKSCLWLLADNSNNRNITANEILTWIMMYGQNGCWQSHK